jgi:hypothetical protein
MLVTDLRMSPMVNISFHLNMFYDHNLGCFNHLARAAELYYYYYLEKREALLILYKFICCLANMQMSHRCKYILLLKLHA